MGFLDKLKSNSQKYSQQLNTKKGQFKNKDFAQASMAMCALIAAADGSIDAAERQKTTSVIKSNDILSIFHPDDLMENFNNYANKLEQDFQMGKVEAVRAIGKLKGKDDQARAVIQIGIIVGGADGNFDPDEQRAVRDACNAVGIAPAEFDLDVSAVTDLAMGANTGLASASGEVVITHAQDPGIDVNLTAFLVGANGKVRSDADMVFFNQPAGEGGSATYHPPAAQGSTVQHRLGFDLSRLPSGVEKIVVALTEDAGGGFAKVRSLQAEVEGIRLVPVPSFSSEKGIMVAEVYVRNGQNKVRAIWQGYSSGLAGLATDHGVDVDDAPAAPPPPPPISTAKAEKPKPKPAAEPSVSFKKVTGNVNLKKGDKPVLMEKTQRITASVTWRTGTDYDVYALVMTKDGQQIDVATFGAKGVAARMDYGGGAVKHLGDVVGSRSGEQTEIIEIRLNPEIVAVVPVAYSAQSNGTGSFYRYKVSLNIDNHSGTNIEISSENANNDDHVFSCVPGIIRNTPEGVVVDPLELYSKRSSENRPKLELQRDGNVRVVMDAGPRNAYK